MRSEVSSLSRRAPPAKLTSGGITIPATVPHSGRESFEGTTPLCEERGLTSPRACGTACVVAEHRCVPGPISRAQLDERAVTR
jgi:hypothetical protein